MMKVGFAAVRAFFGQLPGWLWIVMLAGLAIALGLNAHRTAVKGIYDKGYSAGVLANEQSHIAAQAAADARAQAINSKLRKKNDEENRANDRLADALRLRGPGKAACSSVAASAPAAGGHVPAGWSADAAVGQLPNSERPALIAMPFDDAIAFAAQHDANRAEVLSWRESDRLQSTPVQPQENKAHE